MDSASGETVARIYNAGLTMEHNPHLLTTDIVWNAFYLHALLLDSVRRGIPLFVPHGGKHTNRFNAALDARNGRMVGTGQPHWAHACDECEKIIPRAGPDSPPSMFTCVLFAII